MKGRLMGIALDTKGPEIRSGVLKGGDNATMDLKAGDSITVTTDPALKFECDEQNLYMDYTNLPKSVHVGGLIFVDDGMLGLKVLSIESDTAVKCEIMNNASLGSKKGCNLPEVDVDLPALSEKDKKDLAWGVSQNIDIVFASFIRKAQDVLEVRKCLTDADTVIGSRIRIISKIENHEGMRNFDEILTETDGVMVARGDLGIEIPSEKVFLAQKMMIAKCNMAGKPVICATQMLDSMTTNPRPTRAEASDVANAVLDGADCVMLSGESAKGKYPKEATAMMASICIEAEAALFDKVVWLCVCLPLPCHALPRPNSALPLPSSALPRPTTHSQVLAADMRTMLPSPMSASEAVAKDAALIITTTFSGSSARLLSKFRPRCPIMVLTVCCRLLLE